MSNSGVVISEAVTLSREDQSARETSLFTLIRVIIVIIFALPSLCISTFRLNC